MLLLQSSLPVEASNNSVILPEEMGWFIIGFLLLYCGIVGHVCGTQDWFIIVWKICSVLEMKDGKDSLKASQYCNSLLALFSFSIALSPYSDLSGGASSTRLCCVVCNFWWLWAARQSAPLPSLWAKKTLSRVVSNEQKQVDWEIMIIVWYFWWDCCFSLLLGTSSFHSMGWQFWSSS